MSRLLITGTNSGCGKTTITCAIISALKYHKLTPTAFKCGPDYIDPMFHREAFAVKAYNIDPFLLGDNLISHFASRQGEISIIEGAMGYYDGIGTSCEASAYTVAYKTNTPVILVVDAKGASASLGAVIQGFLNYKKNNNIAGVIFNCANQNRYNDLREIAESVGLRAYGYLPYNKEWSMPSRYLGLLAPHELENLKYTLQEIGQEADRTLDIAGLVKLAKTASMLKASQKEIPASTEKIPLAVARDEAFCFIYEENLEILQELGCELVFFSPLHNRTLPKNIKGLYLPGGYPELHKKKLNFSMSSSIKFAINSGLPTIAEGGGFMYIHQSIAEEPMCGIISGNAFETEKLQRFGYITLTSQKDNLLCTKGESIRSREFHYWDSENPGNDFIAQKPGRNISYFCVHATDTLYAGFPQLYFPANIEFARKFVRRMFSYERNER